MMIEIFVKGDIEIPKVVRNSGRPVQVHIGTGMNLDLIQEHLAGQISAAEFEQFEKLWTDDSHSREFVKEGNYLKIMNKE
jgi:hypothetical protein